VVSFPQLTELGVGRRAINHRVATGRLRRLHRGVYAVGHRRTGREGRWMAAVLAAGPHAVLSHRAAGALWEIARSDRLEVTVPAWRRSRPGLVLHGSSIPADERTRRASIPVTTVARTVLDLAAVLPTRGVERAVDEVEVQRLLDLASLEALIARHPRHRGTGPLTLVLATGRDGVGVTHSELEERFLAFAVAAGLPPPELNADLLVGGRWLEVDCLWRDARLIVELDGRATHATTAAFERDRARDRSLHVAGWRVVRVTWRQLHADGAALGRDLRALLSRPG
jgi:hypothetical protein